MTHFQRVVKYIAICLALLLTISIIFGGLNLMAAIFGLGSNHVLDEHYSVELSQSIEVIEIDISAASLRIDIGESFSLSTNIDNLQVTSKNSRLYVHQKQKNVYINTGKSGEIIITVPADVTLKAFELDAGAGSVEIERLNAQSADMDMGAGAFTLFGGIINNLELDLGVGQTNITAAITGNSTINCGVGETNLHLIGSSDDYSLDVDTGVGSVTVDNMSIRGSTVIGNGRNKLEVDGGVGSVNINFVNE